MEFDKKVSWDGESVDFFIIPSVDGGNRKKELGKFRIEDYVEFMGWYLSEGSVYEPNKADFRISIAQSEKKYRGEILKLLDKMGLKYNNSSEFNIHLHSKDLFCYLKGFGISGEKYIPDDIKRLEPKLIKKFLFALFKGDGSFSSNGKLYKYYTKSKRLAEDVVECLLKIGVCGTISRRKGMDIYMVSVENMHLTPIYRNKVIKKKYSGRVYDFSVRNGTLIVMRDGKVVVSGNCVGWDLKDLLMVGFKGVKGKVESKPAKHLRSALGQMVNFFYTLQGESAGAQAFSNFDTLLAPFVRYDNLSYKEVKQAMQEFVFNMAVPTRVGFQCMSEDTEILTPSGWVGHDGLKEGDVIKTFNVNNGRLEDKVVKKMFSRVYKGVMYNLKNRIQDQLISPGHRVVRRKFGGDNYCLEEVEEVLKMKSPFIVPVSGRNVLGDIEISDDEIKLVAWIISEGTIEHSGQKHRHCKRVTIYQSKIEKQEEYGDIISLLDKFGLEYSVRDSSPALGDSVKMIRLNAESSRNIHEMFGVDDRVDFIPAKFLNMSERQARLFLDVYIKGDGFEGCKISTTSVDILDGLQQIAVCAGYGFTVLTRNPTIGTKMIYVLRLIRHKDTYIQEVKKVDYEGVIWCPNSDNETVIARRNGKVFVTGNTPFTNITMDLEVPSYMKNEHVIVGGQPQMDTYGDFQKEMNMINKAFAECMLEGDASGQVFTFPIPTYNITKNFDFDKPEYDLIWEMAAKYGIPYFSNFVNSDMNPEDARSMCCRLRLDQKELRRRGGGLFGANPQTGSIGVVTINMARLGYVSTSENDFMERLDRLMELSKESLEIKRRTIENFTKIGLYPYSKFYLRQVFQRFGEYWKNHFATIGLLGMNEAVLNFMPGEDITTEKGRAFVLRVLDFMRDRLAEYQKETGSIYNLEATPGEGTTYRFARMDKKRFGKIIVANEDAVQNRGAKPYYTNSSQLPVGFTDDVFEALDLQDELQCKYTGGTVFHTFVGERMTIDSVKKMVKKISANYHLPYFTISPTFSICPIHGYLSGEHEYCPKCDVEIAEGKRSPADDVIAAEAQDARIVEAGEIVSELNLGGDNNG
jgi:ribonucleoside-triphosphate reductase